MTEKIEERVSSIKIRNRIAPGAAGPATYAESMVKQFHGTAPQPTYRPPSGLLLNGRRAAAYQRPIAAISSRVDSAKDE